MPVNPFVQIFTALVFKVVIATKLKTYSQNMLIPEDKEKCEGLLTKEECLQALKEHEPQQNARL